MFSIMSRIRATCGAKTLVILLAASFVCFAFGTSVWAKDDSSDPWAGYTRVQDGGDSDGIGGFKIYDSPGLPGQVLTLPTVQTGGPPIPSVTITLNLYNWLTAMYQTLVIEEQPTK
jgi:hypothetical protein